MEGAAMDVIRFTGAIRYWDPAKSSGLAVVDVPSDEVVALGGQTAARPRHDRWRRVHVERHAGRWRSARAERQQGHDGVAHLAVGDAAAIEISGVGRD